MARTAIATSSSPRIKLAAAFWAVILLVIGLGSCTPEQMPYCEFRDIPSDGWRSTLPMKFEPQLLDSTVQNCTVEIALRHNCDYAYDELNLIVDMIDSTNNVVRKPVRIKVADGYGNWTGCGFGRLYQDKVTVAENVKLSTLHRIVLWPAMKGCEKIENVENIGVIVTPVEN